MADAAGNTRRSFRRSIRLDAYSIIIIALIPSFMLIAAGATWFYERAEAKRACDDTTTYLADVSEHAGQFQSSKSLGNASGWLTAMDNERPPRIASDLHDAAVGAIRYGITIRPDLDISTDGAVYDALAPFQSSLDNARQALVAECPEAAAQIPQAFPMLFRQETPSS